MLTPSPAQEIRTMFRTLFLDILLTSSIYIAYFSDEDTTSKWSTVVIHTLCMA